MNNKYGITFFKKNHRGRIFRKKYKIAQSLIILRFRTFLGIHKNIK
jgi:hypothetical protein